MSSTDEKFGHALVVLSALQRIDAFADLKVPADVEVIPNFGGDPDNIEAWLIFQVSSDASWAEAHESLFRGRALSLLTDAGFPGAALESFVLRFTSTTEIEEGGGRFAFFR
ncbi:MAG TPA: hypothetical protein VFY18_10615 [Candidatus Limnocylindrales bacterium]|nr:hypothetical protein [Candidatus Limnocylindrales bacterium]